MCSSCAQPLGQGLACSPGCEAWAGSLKVEMKQERSRMRATNITQATAFSVLCAGTAFGALLESGVGRGVLGTAAALLLLMALRYFKLASLWKEPKSGA